MSFYSDKIRKYWFPFIILMIIVLAVGWVLAGVIYPNTVQGNDLDEPTQIPPTPTQPPTSTATTTPTAVITSTATSAVPTATPSSNCTYSAYYWSSNSEAWVIENMLLGNLSYTRAEAVEIMTLDDPSPTEASWGSSSPRCSTP